jgi:hypothetical protein
LLTGISAPKAEQIALTLGKEKKDNIYNDSKMPS